MGDMNIRDVTDVTLAAWKKAAIDEGKTLRQWVIDKLNATGIVVEHQQRFTVVENPTVDSTSTPATTIQPTGEPKAKKVIARTVKGTREHAYFLRYAKEKNEFPSKEELVAYMEEDS